MGFLKIEAEMSSLSKVVISLWFRIPEATATAARAPGKIDLADDRFCMQNFVPLISIGPQQDVVRYAVVNPVVHDPDAPPVGFQLNYHDGTVAYTTPSGPTFIGVYYGGESGLYPDGSIIVNIQLSDSPSLSGVLTDVTAATWVDGGWEPTTADGSSYYEQPDCFFGFSGSGHSALDFTATTDKWHHLLISWDITNGCSSHGFVVPVPDDDIIDSASQMFVAFDDTNYNGDDLPAKTANAVSGLTSHGDNDIVSTTIANWAGVTGGIDDSVSLLEVTSVPSNPVSIPGPASQVYQVDAGTDVTINPIQDVIKAELQVFTDVTLDTSDETNRRAFVKADGTPANPALAQSLLGKRPDILLTRYKNFKAGTNSGTLGPFTKTGTLNSYSGSPKLGT